MSTWLVCWLCFNATICGFWIGRLYEHWAFTKKRRAEWEVFDREIRANLAWLDQKRRALGMPPMRAPIPKTPPLN